MPCQGLVDQLSLFGTTILARPGSFPTPGKSQVWGCVLFHGVGGSFPGVGVCLDQPDLNKVPSSSSSLLISSLELTCAWCACLGFKIQAQKSVPHDFRV